MVRDMIAAASIACALVFCAGSALSDCDSAFSDGMAEYNYGDQFANDAVRAIDQINAELARANPRRMEYCNLARQVENSIDNAFRRYNSAETSFSYALISCDGSKKSAAIKNKSIAKKSLEGALTRYTTFQK